MKICTYRAFPTACRPHDPDAAAIAIALVDLIRQQDDRVHVEHIGSSAIPGCAGKGYVDLLLTYPQGLLDAAKRALQALGFQRQQGRDPFPEDRPMRVGLVEYEGREFPVHVHVIANDSAEAVELVRFRDRLRADAGLRLAYAEEKRRILGAGVTDAEAYSLAKTEFIRRVVDQS